MVACALVPLLLWCAGSLTAAAPSRGPAEQVCPATADGARCARQLCGSAPVADSLRCVGLGHTAPSKNVQNGHAAASAPLPLLLEGHGFRTMLDLRQLDAVRTLLLLSRFYGTFPLNLPYTHRDIDCYFPVSMGLFALHLPHMHREIRDSSRKCHPVGGAGVNRADGGSSAGWGQHRGQVEAPAAA
eukprot:SAG31_NODE_4054_length_3633_cov_1.767402_1_plen_186_part_00